MLSSPQHEIYFFSRLENPLWIKPLDDLNVFKYPPKAELVKGGGTHFPRWPVSGYLVRMATKAPDEVARIFSSIETDNPSIIGDMLDAALAMPTEVAIRLVPKICQAARNDLLWINFKGASNLCLKLAKGSEIDAAMELAEALFTPVFEEEKKGTDQRNDFWYKEGLKKIAPLLAEKKPQEFLPELCNWLKVSIDAQKHVKPDTGWDSSYVWRPAIEEHEQNRDRDFSGVMVGFVRNGFEKAIQSKSISLDKALEILDFYTYLIFKRLRLHLINQFAEQNPNLARKEMLNHKFFDSHRFKHEYAMLIGQRLNLLLPEEQDKWFGWIDAGPDMSDFDESIKVHLGRDATEQDRQDRINNWKFEKLHLVRTHLKGEKLRFYEQMLLEQGEPQLADMNIYSGPVRWGDESPMTAEDFKGLTFEQIVNKVSSWQPETSQFMGPNIEGLAATFGEYIATNPELFSNDAKVLINQPAIFVRKFLNQMSEAVKNEHNVNLSAILDLCQWIMEQPIEQHTTVEQDDEMLVDRGWQWARDEITRFIENICKAKQGEAPRYSMDGIRESIWKLLQSLCLDRNESYIVYDTSQDDPRIHDYLNLGINSPRGKAVDAALEYARWIANHIKETNGKREIIPNGFNAMPEVRDMLKKQIESSNRCFEVMSVIGSKISLLYWIDRDWLSKNTENIFQLRGIEQTLSIAEGWAAWNAFLIWVRPHIEFYRLFKHQFAYTVKQATKVELAEDTSEQPMYHLGEHLMLLYGRGQLGLDDDNGLLRTFLEKANSKIRRHAIEFIGQSLEGEKDLPCEISERFMELWDFYWQVSGKDDAKEEHHAWMFGTWFTCGQFPSEWILDRFKQFVEIVPTPESDRPILDKLVEIVDVDMLKSVQILDIIVRGDKEGWHIYSYRDSAKIILGKAIKVTGEVHDKARSLIDYFGRRGYTDFGELL